MTSNASTSTGSLRLPDLAEALPPYTGPETGCVKCSHPEAFTKFRPAVPRHMADRNGVTALRGPLPERLERACQCCDYTWDEALDPAPGVRPATPGDVARALALACHGYAVDLDPQLGEHMAGVLLEMLHLHVRADHPAWTPAAPRPLLVPPATAPTEADAALTASVPIFVQVPEERPAPATAPAVQALAIPLHERPASPAGSTAYAPGVEA